MMRSRARQIGLGVLVVAVVAVLVDRVSLYVWGLGVRSFFRSLDQSAAILASRPASSGSVDQLAWDRVLLVITADGPSGLSFMAASVRPDYIQLERQGVKLWFFPPALAWTTRLFPAESAVAGGLQGYRPVEHYQYMLVVEGSRPVVRLFVGQEHQPVPVTAIRPDIFP